MYQCSYTNGKCSVNKTKIVLPKATYWLPIHNPNWMAQARYILGAGMSPSERVSGEPLYSPQQLNAPVSELVRNLMARIKADYDEIYMLGCRLRVEIEKLGDTHPILAGRLTDLMAKINERLTYPHLWRQQLWSIAFVEDAAFKALNKCKKCGGEMAPGVAMQQTLGGGIPDFPGDKADARGQTMHHGGPGKLEECDHKCKSCGWSVW